MQIGEKWKDWEVVRLIGRGSFGEVYEIQRDVFGAAEKAALKRIGIPRDESETDELVSDGYDMASISERYSGQMRQLVREYTLMSRLKGDANIVICDDMEYRQKEDGVGWELYIRMELLTPLAKVLDQETCQNQAIRLGMDICRALSVCQRENIVHRDIKPQNIFLSPIGRYKLGDFGVAKVAERTTVGTRAGTFRYMAPEVYAGRPYGAAADMYSLGMVLYWLLNRRRAPFLPLPPAVPTARDEEEAQARRMQGEPLPPPVDGSKALKRVVLKACAYEPKDRWPSAESMLAALEALPADGGETVYDGDETVYDRPDAWASPAPAEDEDATRYGSDETEYAPAPAREPEPAPAPGPEPELEKTPEQEYEQAFRQAQPEKKKSKGVLIGALALVLAAIVGALVFAVAGRDGGDAAAQPTAIPTAVPTAEPTAVPMVEPSALHAVQPTLRLENGFTFTYVDPASYGYTAPTALGSDPLSGVLEIDGDLYQMPIPLSAMVENGWEITEDTYQMFDDTAPICLRRNGIELPSMIANLGVRWTGEETVQDWFISYFTYTSYDVEELGRTMPITLPGGIGLGMSPGTVTEKLEEAGHEVNVYDDTDIIDASFSDEEGSCSLSLSLDDAGEIVDFVYYAYYDNSILSVGEGYRFDCADAWALGYVPPTALGTDPLSGVFQFGGEVYQLPAPLSAFLANGWEIMEETYIDGVDGSALLYLSRGGALSQGDLFAYRRGIETGGGIVWDWWVTGVDAYIWDYETEDEAARMLTLPGDVHLGMDADAAQAALESAGHEVKVSGSGGTLSVDGDTCYYSSGIDPESGTLRSISLSVH